MRSGDIADGFRLLPAFAVDDPAVCDYLFVRSTIVRRDTAAKARIEPTAILIAAFEIDIGRESERIATSFQNCDTARTRIEPNVENIGLFAKFRTVAIAAFVAVRQ